MPPNTFGAWIGALLSTLSDGGLLIFTTHGRIAHEDLDRPALDASGYFFAPLTDQKDLPTDEYGCMLVTPPYVLEGLAMCPDAALLMFEEGFWWGKQDVFVVRKVRTDFRPVRSAEPAISVDPEIGQLRATLASLQAQISADQATIDSLRNTISALHASTSWRVTAPMRALRNILG